MNYPVITAICATIGGPVTYVLLPRNAPERDIVISTSPTILSALIPAFLTEATITLDLELNSNVIKRVQAYEIGNHHPQLWYGDYSVNRIATQRQPNGLDEHLEVFLLKDEQEKAYNVYDSSHKKLLLAAFAAKNFNHPIGINVHVEIDGNTITTVCIGERHPFK